MNRLVGLIGRRYPTLFIGVPGVLMLVVGLVAGVWVTIRVLNVHLLPLGSTLASASLCIAGAMCIVTSVVLSKISRLQQEVLSRRAVSVGDPTSYAQLPVRTGSSWILLVFGLPGLTALLVGLLWGTWAVSAIFTRGSLLPGSYIGSVSWCIAGLLALLTGMVLQALHEVQMDVQGVS